MKTYQKLTLFLTALMAFCSPISASELLKGVGNVGILLGQLDAKVEEAGVKKDELMSLVESKLQKSNFDPKWEAGKPYLNVRIRAISLSEDTMVCYLQLSLNEVATLKRNLAWISATTWSQSSLLVVPTHELPAQVKRIIGEMTDQFIKEFMAANKKETPPSKL
ncbi:MAG: hypothetical protein K0S07_113 [Chlamydiales bacterium]|jgi:hypothetical protein|nr:hypothetical protein [Chlamydiales bacterium]